MRPIEATVRAGAFLPTEALALAEGELVALLVVRRPDPARWNLVRPAPPGEEDALSSAGLSEWADELDREDRG